MRLFEFLALRDEDVSGAEALQKGAIPELMADQLKRTEAEYGGDGWNTKGVAANAVDERIRSLCRFYASASRDLQRSMRAAVTQPTASDLLCFALRSAIFALRVGTREAAQEEVFNGILAVALGNLANEDPRDDIVVLHKLYEAGKRSGVNSLAVFNDALPHCGSSVVQILNDYYFSRPMSDVGEGFSFELIVTPHGLSIEYP